MKLFKVFALQLILSAAWAHSERISSLSVQNLREAPSCDWTQVGSDFNGEATYDRYGYTLAFSRDGSTFAASAPFNDGIDASRTDTSEFSHATLRPVNFRSSARILTAKLRKISRV